MCLIVLSLAQHPDYPLILAANRDEFHARPTQAAGWWPDKPDMLGGRDLQAGGTWLAASRNGRFATVTNFGERRRPPPRGRTRGELVTGFLDGDLAPADYLDTIEGDAYAGFNLVVGDTGSGMDKPTMGKTFEPVDEADRPVNIFEAIGNGAMTGMQVAFSVGAMLVAFVALVALVNGALTGIGGWFGFEELTLQWLLGWVFMPIALLLGVPVAEAVEAGSLIGQKLVINEFYAYLSFVQIKEALSPHTQLVVTFALCGFANLSSIAILLGGLGAVVPERRSDIARLGLRAVIGGTLANLMNASLLFALFWGIWHLPLSFINDYYHSNLVDSGWIHSVNFLLSLFPFVIIMNWLYFKTGRSILAAILFPAWLRSRRRKTETPKPEDG